MLPRRSIGVTLSGWLFIITGGYFLILSVFNFHSMYWQVFEGEDFSLQITTLLHFINYTAVLIAGIQILRLVDWGRRLALALSVVWFFYYLVDFCFYQEIDFVKFLFFVSNIFVYAILLIFLTRNRIVDQFR
jgi:hypothetical protein